MALLGIGKAIFRISHLLQGAARPHGVCQNMKDYKAFVET